MTAFKIPTRPIAPKGEQRQPRKHEVKHLDFIRQLPCLVCGNPNETEAAHLRAGSLHYGKPVTGAGRKPDDRWTLPLCGTHHRNGPEAQHAAGDEVAWWTGHRIDPFVVAALLFSHGSAGDLQAAEAVCRRASRGLYPPSPRI